jgi:hypothetical protein
VRQLTEMTDVGILALELAGEESKNYKRKN